VRLSNVPNADMTEVEELTQLRKISFVGGPLHEGNVAHLSKLKYLQALYISTVDASDADLAPLAEFPSLREVDLVFNNHLTEACLEPLSRSSDLRILRLGGMRISAAGVVQLKKMAHLSELELRGPEIDDQTMMLISDIRQLETLRLYSSQITPAGLAHLRVLTHLQSLALDRQIDSQWVSELQQLPSLKELEIYYSEYPTPAAASWLQGQLRNIRITYESQGGGNSRIPSILPPSSQRV
jgi:hypothetical protein